jgi:hypothetical protein
MKKLVTCICVLSLILLSCSKDSEDVIGESSDTIKLSLRKTEFKSGADSVVITTEGDGWWIHSVTVDNNIYFADIQQGHLNVNYMFSNDCFDIQRRGGKTLFVKLKANDSGKNRTVKVKLQAGNFFDDINIIQKGKD